MLGGKIFGSLALAACVLVSMPTAIGQQTEQPTEQEVFEAIKGFIPLGLRSIPSESRLPNLLVGDRIAIVAIDRDLRRGDVVIFKHPHSDRVMIKCIIGLPGDTVQMREGQLILNGEAVARTPVREVIYRPDDGNRLLRAEEYQEQLPGEEQPHLIHEFSNSDSVDETPEFRVPAGHLFMMGDNRDNSEDSRAPSGHRAMASASPELWPYRSAYLPRDTRDDAIGFVPIRNLMGRGGAVIYTTHACMRTVEQREAGAACLRSRLWAAP